VFRRCVVVALVVGTLLSLLNQGDYLIPFVVANLGAMTSLRHDRRPPSGR
jgi:hypothetical protein